MHYAAVDAFILLEIFEQLKVKWENKGIDISEFREELIESVKESQSPLKQIKKQKMQEKNDEKPKVEIPSGPKLFLSESLNENRTRKSYKFYGDPMMKNLHKLLVYNDFDSILSNQKIKKNKIVDDKNISKTIAFIIFSSKWVKNFPDQGS